MTRIARSPASRSRLAIASASAPESRPRLPVRELVAHVDDLDRSPARPDDDPRGGPARSRPAPRGRASRGRASPTRARPGPTRDGRARPRRRVPGSAACGRTCTRRRAPRRRRRARARAAGSGPRSACPTTTRHVALADAPPLVGALPLAERAVEDRHVDAEVGAQPVDERRRERDLRARARAPIVRPRAHRRSPSSRPRSCRSRCRPRAGA